MSEAEVSQEQEQQDASALGGLSPSNVNAGEHIENGEKVSVEEFMKQVNLKGFDGNIYPYLLEHIDPSEATQIGEE